MYTMPHSSVTAFFWGKRLFKLCGFALVLSLTAFAAEPVKTRFLPLEGDGSPAPDYAKKFEWGPAECVLGEDDKELNLVAKGKDFREGKLELTLLDYDTDPVEAVKAYLYDQNDALWGLEPKLRTSSCEVKVSDKEFENGKLAKAKLSVKCLGLVSIDKKKGGTKGYMTAENAPIVCETVRATSARQP